MTIHFLCVLICSMRPLECKNNCPKIKICFGYVKLHDFLGNILCDCKERGESQGIPANILIYQLKLGTIVLRHRTAQSIPSFILSSTSTSSHIFVGLLRLFCATTSSLCCALRILTTLFYWCRVPHPGPGCQALKEGRLR